MKRLIVLLVVAGALLAPSGAFASGVVIKVQDRRLVVVARTPSNVVLVHTPAKVAVGERIALQARRLRNSTLAASRIKVLGRVSQVRFRGLLLSKSGPKLMVSAGGAVVELHRGAHRNDSAPRPGSTIQVTVTIGADGELDEDDVTTVSPTAPGGQIEGRLLLGTGTVTVSPSTEPPAQGSGRALADAVRAGMEVLATFSQGTDGSLTLTALSADGDAEQADDDGGTTTAVATTAAVAVARRCGTVAAESMAVEGTTRSIRRGRRAGREDVSPLLLRRLSDEQLGSRLASARRLPSTSCTGVTCIGSPRTARTCSGMRRLGRRRCPVDAHQGLRRVARRPGSRPSQAVALPDCSQRCDRSRHTAARAAVGRVAREGSTGSGEPVERSGALVAALAALPDRQRRVYVLRELHGLRIDETAAELDALRRRRWSSRSSLRATGLPSISSSATGSTASPCSVLRSGRSSATSAVL